MAELVYAEFHKIIKTYLAKNMSDVNVAELLLDAIILQSDLSNKAGDPFVIEKHTISKIINRSINIPLKIKNAASFQDVIDNAPGYFKKNVVPKLSKGIESKVIKEITNLIDIDDNVPVEIKQQLKKNAAVSEISFFLADVLLYTVKINNRKSEIPKQEMTYKNKPLPEASVPKEIQTRELPYVTAILKAYGDKEKKEFNKEDLKSSLYHDNFNRHRKSYFNAEYLDRKSRDAYSGEEPAPFEVLKEETYNGVIDTWDMDYSDGYARLNNVMAQASQIRVDSCLLSKETSWITNDVKKGVCHMLVNDEKIKGWVK